MPNSLSFVKTFIPILDEVYKLSSLTSKLDGASELARQGANANELIVPKISMDGLGDYDRNSGYVSGDVTLTNETVACNYDRGRMFQVDNVDNMDTAGIAFGRLSGEFIRTKVVPELDAFRFSEYSGLSGISTAEAILSTAANVIAALRAAVTQMDEDEVPDTDRHLFITPTLYGLIMDLDTTKSKEVMSRFASVTQVPQSRFYTKISFRDGKTAGQTAGGFMKYAKHYKKAASGDTGALKVVADSATSTTGEIKVSTVTPVVDAAYTPAANDYVVPVVGQDINFMIVHKPALIQFTKHTAPKVITPDVNQDADAYKFGYRLVGIADAYENKVAGIYLHCKPAV